jgi:FKBP-type peptidyl-prolyl cis-trans isomerase
MKKTSFLIVTGLVLGAAVANAQDITFKVPDQAPASATAPAAVAAAPTHEQLVEEFGWFFAKKFGIDNLDFSQSEIQALNKGMAEAMEGKDSPYDLQKIGPLMDDYMQGKRTGYLARLKQHNQVVAADFFAKLKEDKDVVVLPSGLCYKIIAPGSGPGPAPTDTVRVNYTGTLLDGTVFDTSYQPRQPGGVPEPAEFALNSVIPGWTEGMQKIGKGGRIKLYIPAELGYADQPQQNIPPGSALIFDVELLDINPAPAAK